MCRKHFYILTENNQASRYDLSVESDSDALFHWFFSHILFDNCNGLFMCTKADPWLLLFLSVADVWWVAVDSICSSHGFDPMGARPQLEAPPLSSHLHLWGQLTTTGQLFSSFALLCLWVSGGLFVPCAGTMQAVGSRTILCSVSREETARSDLHIILCKENPCYLYFQASLALFLSTGWKGKKTFRVHVALPSQINMVVPERDYLCNNQSLKVIKFVVVLSNFQCVWMLRWTR